MTAQNQPPSQAQALGELWRRVQILEAVSVRSGDYVLLEEQELDVDVVAPGFTGIPSGFRHLRVEGLVRRAAGGGANFAIAFNYDGVSQLHSSANDVILWDDDGGLSNITSTGNLILDVAFGASTNSFFIASEDLCPNNPEAFSIVTIDLPYYRKPTFKTCVITVSGQFQEGPGAPPYDGSYAMQRGTGVWRSTDPVTDIGFLDQTGYFGTFETGSVVSLYGIR